MKLPLKKILKHPSKASLKVDVPSFLLLHQQENHLISTETYEPNSQPQYLNVSSENITNDPVAIPTGIFGYIDFPAKIVDFNLHRNHIPSTR